MADAARIPHCCGATAPIRPLAWEPSYASGAALEKTKKKKKRPKKNYFLIDSKENTLFHFLSIKSSSDINYNVLLQFVIYLSALFVVMILLH